MIIKYPDSFVYTSDLADSIHARGELSNHCMEVGLEYLRRTNTVEGKMIVPYQISLYLMNGEFQKKAVVSMFKRTEKHSLSFMKQVEVFCSFCFSIVIAIFSAFYIHYQFPVPTCFFCLSSNATRYASQCFRK